MAETNIDPHKCGRRPLNRSDSFYKAILDDYAVMPAQKIAEKYSVTRRTVFYWLREARNRNLTSTVNRTDSANGVHKPQSPNALRNLPKPYTAEEEKAAFQKLASEKPGSPEYINTFNEISTHNLKLVRSMAIKSAQRYKGGCEVMDMFQAGYLGLCRAIEKFDLSAETRFSTYAVFWIQQFMQGCQRANTACHLPEYFYAKFNQIDRIRADLTQKLGHVPTNREVAKVAMLDEEMEVRGASKELVSAYNSIFNRRRVEGKNKSALDQFLARQQINLGAAYIDWLDELRNIANPMSLNQSSHNSLPDIGEIIDLIKDPADTPDEISINQTSDSTLIEFALSSLTAKERRIITIRFGLAPNTAPCTLDETAGIMHLTRERIRQIEAKTLRKMHHTLISAGYDLDQIIPYQAV